MSEKHPLALLAQMQHAAPRACIKVECLRPDDFAQEATLMNLLLMGEMATRLTRGRGLANSQRASSGLACTPDENPERR